ncbi:major facilitator superfamily protein, partial [Kipferlia bialata]|eukprot:g16202.t1
MSIAFLGIQFGWSLQMSNMSSIYQILGADESDIPILWLGAPLTGLFVQPIIGFMSDRINPKYGRRKPFILGGTLTAVPVLALMPFARTI